MEDLQAHLAEYERIQNRNISKRMKIFKQYARNTNALSNHITTSKSLRRSSVVSIKNDLNRNALMKRNASNSKIEEEEQELKAHHRAFKKVRLRREKLTKTCARLDDTQLQGNLQHAFSRWKSVSAQDREQQQFHDEQKSQEAQKEEEDQPEQAQIRRKSKKDQRRDHFEQMAAERVNF